MRTTPLPSTAKQSGAAKRSAPDAIVAKRKAKSDLLKYVLKGLDDAKAEDIVTLDLDGKAALADQMVVASGRSNRHVAAITEQLEEKLKKKGFKDLKIEGLPHCDWVLVDAGDVIVHIFRPEVRTFYNLEKLWSPNAPADRAVN